VVRHTRLRDIFSTFECAEPAYRADGIDEYRELAMLAGAWEHGSLKPPGGAEGGSGRVDDPEGKESALR
jgi:hypothetical protein